jgi:photosystem II stability/assembly factor-like uncharacterized protein
VVTAIGTRLPPTHGRVENHQNEGAVNARSARAWLAAASLLLVSCSAPSRGEPRPSSVATPSGTQAPEASLAAAPTDDGIVFQAQDIAFWNADHGVVTGRTICRSCPRHRTGVVMVTRDGGATWRVVVSRGGIATDVVTTGPASALVRVGDHLLLLSRHGREWTSLGPSRVHDLTFVDPWHGWGVRDAGYPGHLVATTDGGRSWRLVEQPCRTLANFSGPTAHRRSTPVNYLSDVWFASVDVGWALCAGDGAMDSAPVAVFATTDGGATWQRREASWDAEPGGLQFLPDGRGWRWPYDIGSVMRSADGGATWRRGGSLGNNAEGSRVWFVSAHVGYALGEGDLWRSRDGGRTWRRIGPIVAS